MLTSFFDFIANGRTIKFRNLSEGALEYQWDFGDDSGISTEINPEHTFAGDGTYTITLTAEDDVNSIDFAVRLVVSAINGAYTPVYDLIKQQVPERIQSNAVWILNQIRQWQMNLQPFIDTPFTPIAVEDTNDETKWPGLVNLLISKLVVYDLIIDSARKFAMNSQGKGPLKRLETGPSNAEWFDGSTLWGELMKPDGFLSILTQEVCMLGYAAKLVLPMCPTVVGTGTFIVGKKEKIFYTPWPVSKGGESCN